MLLGIKHCLLSKLNEATIKIVGFKGMKSSHFQQLFAETMIINFLRERSKIVDAEERTQDAWTDA